MGSQAEPRAVTPLRAAGYVRVSMLGGRGDDLMSPDLQLASIREHCRRRGFDLVEVVEDIDKSGRSWRPRQIGRLVDEVAAGQLDAIVVWKWSRFARHRVDWAVHVDRVESAGGVLESATEAIDTTTSAGRFARGMLAELAAFESERTGDTWRDVHRARFEAGLPPGAWPFGWRRAGRGIEPDPAQAPIVADLYRRYIAGAPLRQLAVDLNRSGLASPRGGQWAATSLRNLLDSPIHAGMVVLNGETRPGAHDGIIDAATWQAYQARRRIVRSAPRREASPFLLSGLVFCGICGHALAGNGRRYPQYRCPHANNTGAHPFAAMSTRRVEAPVMDHLALVAEGVNAAAERVPAGLAAVPDVDVLARDVAAVDRKLAVLLLRSLDGMPAAAVELARASLIERRDELASQLAVERDRRALASPAPRAAALDLLADWDVLPLTAKRAGLRALIRRVVVRFDTDRTVEVEPQA